MPEELCITVSRRYALVPHVCPVCKSSFTGTKKKTYCSDRCQRQAAWSRNGGKANEKRKQERREKHQEG